MSKLPKVNEFTKKEIKRMLDKGYIDIDFLCDYISRSDRVYNIMIDRINELEQENQELKDKLKEKKD